MQVRSGCFPIGRWGRFMNLALIQSHGGREKIDLPLDPFIVDEFHYPAVDGELSRKWRIEDRLPKGQAARTFSDGFLVT